MPDIKDQHDAIPRAVIPCFIINAVVDGPDFPPHPIAALIPTLRPEPAGTTSGTWQIKRQFNNPVCGPIRAPGLSFENNTDGENPVIAVSCNVSIRALVMGQLVDHPGSSTPSRARKTAVQLS